MPPRRGPRWLSSAPPNPHQAVRRAAAAPATSWPRRSLPPAGRGGGAVAAGGGLVGGGPGGEAPLSHESALARPPPVQRGLGGQCALGDRRHGQVRIADFHKQIRGGAQYGSVDSRIPGPPRGLVNG